MASLLSQLRLASAILFALSLALSGQPAPDRKAADDSRRLGNLEDRVSEQSRRIGGLDQKISAVEGKADAADRRANQTQSDLVKTQVELAKTAGEIDKVVVNAGVTRRDLDRFWVLLAAVLVFFMQAGFKCLEVGMARRQFDASLGVMNLMNWLVLCVVFYCCGFGLMFGQSLHGLIGTNLFFPSATDVYNAYKPLGLEFFLFQLAFAATAATIVDGAIAERTALLPYIVATCLAGTLVYPVFGHWVWNSSGWLVNLGNYKFHDFAGSTVVHSVGAWISLVGVLFVGPRRFRFSRLGHRGSAPYSLGYAVLGVIMLWFGWWGFKWRQPA